MGQIVIVGNGILGITTAIRLLKQDHNVKITLIGPSNHHGCASLAAAAMFNSFGEIEAGTLRNESDRKKFLFNKLSTPLWPLFLKEIECESELSLDYGFGTYIINNHASDSLEDENFDAIVNALNEFEAKYETIVPRDIPHYNPGIHLRAGRALFIHDEGWVNPATLFDALKKILARDSRVTFIDGFVESLLQKNGKISEVVLQDGKKVTGDVFLLSPGAAFSKIVSASNLEIKLPKIFYGVGCSLLLKTGAETLKNCIRTPNRGLACGIYAAPHNSEHTLVGASNFISPIPEDTARATSVYTLLKASMEQINSDFYRSGVVKVNVGWRPTSEDTLPLLGATSIPNLFVATGTKRDGLHCSPVISNVMANLILGKSSPYDISYYTPEREPRRTLKREEAITLSVRHIINAAYQHDFAPAKNRMIEHLENHYREDLNKLHDKVGAVDWGIPPELIDMYRYGHIV